jgi:hypothetical protein
MKGPADEYLGKGRAARPAVAAQSPPLLRLLLLPCFGFSFLFFYTALLWISFYGLALHLADEQKILTG